MFNKIEKRAADMMCEWTDMKRDSKRLFKKSLDKISITDVANLSYDDMEMLRDGARLLDESLAMNDELLDIIADHETAIFELQKTVEELQRQVNK